MFLPIRRQMYSLIQNVIFIGKRYGRPGSDLLLRLNEADEAGIAGMCAQKRG